MLDNTPTHVPTPGLIKPAATAALIVVAAILLTVPVAELPFNDDWSYAFSALQWARTGHLLYNGWSAASAIAHVYWGMVLIRIFGFSFTILRLGTLPFAAGCAWLCVLVARTCGLPARRAVFVALSLGLSPLFLPLATSFMTDVPALFFLLLSIYALLRSAERDPRRTTWLITAIVAGCIGGTSRQIIWIAPLIALPYLALYRRRDKSFVLAAAVGWAIVLVVVYWTMSWFARQPYARLESPVLSDLRQTAAHPGHFALSLCRMALTVGLVTLPALFAVVPRLIREALQRHSDPSHAKTFTIAALAITLLVAIALARRPDFLLYPWIPNTLTPSGVMGNNELPGFRDIAVAVPVRALIGALVYCAIITLAAAAVANIVGRGIRRSAEQFARFFIAPSDAQFPLAMLTLVCIAYSMLVLTRLAQDLAFDRYLLPLIPAVGIAMLLWRESMQPRDQSSAAAPVAITVAWTLLVVFALYAVASTADVLALSRARVAATRRLMDAGIPRTHIQAGFEFDCWTELLQTGHVDRTRTAADMTFTPSIHPDYRVEFQAASYTGPTPFGSVDYDSPLPPFHHQICIDTFTGRAPPATLPSEPH